MKKLAFYLLPFSIAVATGGYLYQRTSANKRIPFSQIDASDPHRFSPVPLDASLVFHPPSTLASAQGDPDASTQAMDSLVAIERYCSDAITLAMSRGPGQIVENKGLAALMLNGKKVFEAKFIGNHCVSENGFIILDAVEGAHTPPEKAALTATKHTPSPRQIWLVSPDGQTRKISPESTVSNFATISPDGKSIAYITRPTDRRGSPGRGLLYIGDTAGLKYQLLSPNIPDHQIVPARWEDSGRSLVILQTAPDTGAQRQLYKIPVPVR